MLIPPADVISSWPAAHFDDPVTRGEALLVLMIMFSVLVVLAVAARFYSRIVVKRWFGFDDGFIAVALIFTIAMNAVVILANQKYGWDRHIWDVPWSMYQNANIIAFTAKLLFVGAATFTRISLLCFYYRLVKDSGIAWFKTVLHASMVFVIVLGIAFTCVGVFLCIPVQSYWVFPPMAEAKCLNEGVTVLTIGVFNCVADLLVTILPIPMVMRLKMPLKHRVGVSILLSLGLIVTIAGVLRTYFIWQSLIATWDQTWYSYPLWICATVEIDVAVICACAPALKPLLHKPITRITSKLSPMHSKAGSSPSGNLSNRPHQPSDTTRSNKSSVFRLPFRRDTNKDTVWEGDDEYGILRLTCQGKDSAIVMSASRGEVDEHDREDSRSKLGTEGRTPPLEIMRRFSVEQEITYLPLQDQRGNAGGYGRVEDFA